MDLPVLECLGCAPVEFHPVIDRETEDALLVFQGGVFPEDVVPYRVCAGGVGPEDDAVLEGLGCAAFDGEFVAGGPAEPAVLPAVGAPVVLDGASGEAGAGAWRPVDLPVLECLGCAAPEFHFIGGGEAKIL